MRALAVREVVLLISQYLVVDLTKCRSDVDDSSAVFDCYKVS